MNKKPLSYISDASDTPLNELLETAEQESQSLNESDAEQDDGFLDNGLDDAMDDDYYDDQDEFEDDAAFYSESDGDGDTGF
ncbi:MAG: hypothetical protein IGS03_09725 [Candidatus Sericytochromatia bacterium]|nr:hypothetical protein [Candidatus Sericytochromatia bacterium]